MIERAAVLHVMPRAAATVDAWLTPLDLAAGRFGITTGRRIAMWLANIAEESQELTHFEENLHYTHPDRLLAVFPHEVKDLVDANALVAMGPEGIANRVYFGRNGNRDAGDGWKYRGRGPLEVTGRANYRAASLGVANEETLLIDRPELVAEPTYGALTAGWYWASREISRYADVGNFDAVCEIINHGVVAGRPAEGIDQRRAYYRAALEVFS